jgi:uncharacterized protein (UPF0335 family)
MKWNAWWLPLWLGVALSAVYFLPRVGEVADSAVKMELPGSTGGWSFQTLPANKDELGTLPPDTEFAKAICLRPRPGEVTSDGRLVPDRVDLSVVLSGYDLNSSIHRPERCMPAQGHTITDSRNVTLHLANGRGFDAKRLRSMQTIKTTAVDNKAMQFQCVTYYFFVGHDRVTNDHLGRTLLDMKDRLVRGMDQRWAYVSASMWYGKMPWIDKDVTEAEADEKLRKFITGFAENQIDWDQIQR